MRAKKKVKLIVKSNKRKPRIEAKAATRSKESKWDINKLRHQNLIKQNEKKEKSTKHNQNLYDANSIKYNPKSASDEERSKRPVQNRRRNGDEKNLRQNQYHRVSKQR